ncbi:hypothetical protein FD723_39665 (plasmid) [Nostoc sp. C052]|uniref:hypothetical protein n=1 Tax=Nostoc sp. C052 TaxID=2576902 RepID=UPI0015C3BC94|nr:hypothetical protein [Nostoc sp. C052]QLE46330.1 hypothetical protein FD723_39665 [Nostoc sp. C052]
MRSKSQILRSYEYVFQCSSIAYKDIVGVARHMQGIYKYEDEDLSENQNFIEKYRYRESYFPISKDIDESDFLLAKFKNKIFSQQGNLRKTFYNCNIKDKASLIFYANKIDFLGFIKVLFYFPTKKEDLQKLSVYPVFRFSGQRGMVTFQESSLYRGKKYIQTLDYRKYTPQEVVCKGCQYYCGQSFYGVLFNCAPHPSGPNGYQFCHNYTNNS